MDRERTEEKRQGLTRWLQRFCLTGLAGLGLAMLPMATLERTRILVPGVCVGGGWILVNVAALAWMIRASLGRHATPSQHMTRLIAAVGGPLALGALAMARLRPSLIGLLIGVTVGLGIFVAQFQRLKKQLLASA